MYQQSRRQGDHICLQINPYNAFRKEDVGLLFLLNFVKGEQGRELAHSYVKSHYTIKNESKETTHRRHQKLRLHSDGGMT